MLYQDNILKIKEKIKNSPELLSTLIDLENKAIEKDEIFLYCIKRTTLLNKVHYIPLISFYGKERSLMACNDLKILQEDFNNEIKSKYNNYPVIILMVSFDTYARLALAIEEIINAPVSKIKLNSLRRLKAELLLNSTQISGSDFQDIKNDISLISNYCKCLDENLNIVNCEEYLPI